MQSRRNHDAADRLRPHPGLRDHRGYVYHGSALPAIAGRYFYSDFCSGWLRSFLARDASAVERIDWGITPVGNIQSFGVDSSKELYALTSAGGVYRLVRQ